MKKRRGRMKRIGQSAIEFLMTYGWAILAAVIVVGVLWYMIGDPSNLIGNDFKISAPLVANAILIDSLSIQIGVINGGSVRITVSEVDVGECSLSTSTDIDPGASHDFVIPCSQDSGDKVDYDVSISYRLPGSNLVQSAVGSVSGKVSETIVPGDTSDWWDNSFGQRKTITIDNSGSSTLTDFPAYISLSYDSDMQSDFDDLRFTSGACGDAGGTELDYEIESYSASTSAEVWVRIPTFSSGENSICMYYGNSGASSGENAASVWDSNYKGVWHMSEVNAVDSTSNNNDGTQSGGVAQASGKANGANEFDGSNDYINNGAGSSLDIASSGQVTIEAWIYANNVGGSGNYIIGKRDTANVGYVLGLKNDGSLYAVGGSSTPDVGVVGSAPSLNNWHYVVGIIDGTTGELYIDGQSDTTDSSINSIVSKPSVPLSFGCAWSGMPMFIQQYFDGRIEEVRVSQGVRSADWIKQSYEVVENQGSVVNFGSEVSL